MSATFLQAFVNLRQWACHPWWRGVVVDSRCDGRRGGGCADVESAKGGGILNPPVIQTGFGGSSVDVGDSRTGNKETESGEGGDGVKGERGSSESTGEMERGHSRMTTTALRAVTARSRVQPAGGRGCASRDCPGRTGATLATLQHSSRPLQRSSRCGHANSVSGSRV